MTSRVSSKNKEKKAKRKNSVKKETTLIVRQGKVYETLIMRSWTWVKKKKKLHLLKRNGNKTERKCDDRNVAET